MLHYSPDMMPRNVDDSPIQFSLLLIVMTLLTSTPVAWLVKFEVTLLMLAWVRCALAAAAVPLTADSRR